MLTKRSALRYSLLAFLCLNLAFILFLFLVANAGGASLAIIANLTTYFLFIVIALISVIQRKNLVLLSKILLGILFALLLVVGGVLMSGLFQDLSGQQCSGFWGTSTECIGNSWFIVVIILGYSLMTYAPALFFASAVAVQLRANSKPRTASLQNLLDKTK